MKLGWSKTANNNLTLLSKIPDNLKAKLTKVCQIPYAELYEQTTDEVNSLQDALEEILVLFADGNLTLGHIRHVWMALILAIVVRPTVEHYQPNNYFPDATIEKITLWLLLETIKTVVGSETSEVQFSSFDKLDTRSITTSSSPENLASFQIFYEVVDVYINALKTIDESQSLAALINILDDCLEGYAIFPGSDGRRELLNWWLLDVVPAAWYLLPPNFVYVIDSSPTSEKIVAHQKKMMDKISSLIWLVILKAKKKKPYLNENNLIDLNVKKNNNLNLDSNLSISVYKPNQPIRCS